MTLKEKYKTDIEIIFSMKKHLGGDLWTTEDNRIGKGSPFSARDVAIMLADLGFTKKDTLVKALAGKIFMTWQEDGRFKMAPSGSIFACHTISALRALCCLGYSGDKRLKITFDYLKQIQHVDGGWRCNKVKMGKGPETDCSNPGTTLEALDAFRFIKKPNDKSFDHSIEFLLRHWEIKKPLGPCYFGIGTLFMQTEFPFFRYNLFYFCNTLSYYSKARKDKRFKEALKALEKKLVDGKLVIENPNRQLAMLSFCLKDKGSDLATKKYQEIKKRCGISV